MGRVLLVESDDAARALLRGIILAGGHEAMEAADGAEALSLASSGVDLVVCDVGPPDMRAAELRTRLRRALSSFPVPFVFVSADVEKDARTIVELARAEYLFLFHKPPDQAKFKRTLDALIGAQRVVEGRFEDGSFDRILATIESGEESGVLTAYRGTVVKKVAFERGTVTFCGSNDPRERVGHALIKAGLITEEDLKQALGMQEGSISSLTVILEKLGKATSKQMDEVVAKKFREAVLDLYLWQDGTWVFQGGAAAVENPSRLLLELGPLRAEGRKRAPRWKAVVAMFPDEDIRFDVKRARFPPGFPANAGDRKLVELAERGLGVGAIRLELAGQDYAVLVRLAELVKLGVLEKRGLPGPGPMEADQIAERAALAAAAARSAGAPKRPAGSAPAIAAPPPPAGAPPAPPDAPPPPPGAPPPPEQVPEPAADPVWAMLHEAEAAAALQDVLGAAAPLFDRGNAVESLMTAARAALESKELEKAARTFHAILKLEPSHVLARRGLAQVDGLIARRAEGAGILRRSQVVLAMPAERAAQLAAGAGEGFVLTRISREPIAVEALVSVCPMPETELLEMLRRFLAEGWISVV